MLHWAQAALLAMAYFGIGRFALMFAIPPGYATAVWPSSGIALAVLLLFGNRLWPGVWLGAAMLNATVSASLVPAAVIASGNTLEALAAAWLIRRYIGVPYRFLHAEHVVIFVLTAALCATVAATIGVLPLAVAHGLDWPQVLWNWGTWWEGDLNGMLVLTPLILAWCAPAEARREAALETRWTPRRQVEAAALVLLLLVVARLAFGEPHGSLSFKFVILPFVLWAAFRFGQREVTTVIALACGIALWYTIENSGRIGGGSNDALLVLLAFNNVVVLTGLVLAAVLGERARAVEELRRRHAELEARVEARTRELRSATRAKSDFLATMSHELRTPLNSLLILAGLLRDNGEKNLSARQIQYAQTIHAAGTDLLMLINEILELARIEAGAAPALDIAPLKTAALVTQVENTFRPVAAEKGLDFRIDVAAAPAEIDTDARRLQQVLKNLLANAFKFTRQGGVTLRISRARGGWPATHESLNAARDVIAFTVADTGIGIPLDRQEAVFEAFQQADRATSVEFGGTGLGLSISRELSRLLGGEIVLESLPGHGSSFTLYLPQPAPPQPAATPEPPVLRR